MAKETFRTLFVVLSALTFITAFILIGVLIRGGFRTPTPITIPEQPAAKKVIPLLDYAIGQLTTSGLDSITGEKARLGLTLSDYELSLPQDTPATFGGDRVYQLVFEDTNFDYTKYLGNCVEIGYVPVRDKDLKQKDNLKSYSLYPVVVWEVNIGKV